MEAAIHEAWECISEDFLWKLTESIEKRIRAVITVDGGYTKY